MSINCSITKLGNCIRINDDNAEKGNYIIGVTKDVLKTFRLDFKEATPIRFKVKYGINKSNIEALGTSKRVTLVRIEPYISRYDYLAQVPNEHNSEYSKVERTSFRCCAKGGNAKDYVNDFTTAGHIIHEDLKSAWKCINNILKEPEAIIIIRK